MNLSDKKNKANLKHIKLFEKIATPYAWFFSGQLRSYTILIERYKKKFSIHDKDSVLDIGCGTGALSQALQKNKLEVTAIDASGKMLKKANDLRKEKNINFLQADLSIGLPFSDKSFDYVFAAYVAHGLSPELRQILYKEGIRLARKKFILYDYLPNKYFIISLIEWLEGGDYFYFKDNVKKELDELSKTFEIVPVSSYAAFYVIEV